MTQPSPDSLLILESLRRAVHKALERKRLLGQYAVVARDGKPVRLGIDVPWGDEGVADNQDGEGRDV